MNRSLDKNLFHFLSDLNLTASALPAQQRDTRWIHFHCIPFDSFRHVLQANQKLIKAASEHLSFWLTGARHMKGLHFNPFLPVFISSGDCLTVENPDLYTYLKGCVCIETLRALMSEGQSILRGGTCISGWFLDALSPSPFEIPGLSPDPRPWIWGGGGLKCNPGPVTTKAFGPRGPRTGRIFWIAKFSLSKRALKESFTSAGRFL